MRIGSLRVLDAFIRLGGTKEAGQALGMSQSAVIKALHGAEGELGLDLVASVQGRLLPTPEARALRERAQALFRAVRGAEHEADMVRIGMAGRLRIATVPGLAHSLLPGAITDVRNRCGDTASIEIMFDQVAGRLASGEADIGLSYGPLAGRDLVDEPVAHSALVCVLAPGDPSAGVACMPASELEGRLLVGYGSADAAAEDSLRLALLATGLLDSLVVTVRHTDMACHLVRDGIGVAIIDGFVISSELARGLAVVPLADSPPVTAFAHYLRGIEDDPVANVLLDSLRERS